MSVQGLFSQGLLLLAGFVHLLTGGLTDAHLTRMLAAMLVVIFVNLLHPRRAAYLPMAVYLALGVMDPAMLSFAPLMLYLCLTLPDAPWPAAAPGLLLVYHYRHVDMFLGVILLAALLLRYKDDSLARMQARYFAAVDDSSERATRQQRELSSMQHEQETSVKLAVAQERNRIARDIHDNVGHILSRSLLQVKALSLNPADPDLKRNLDDLHDSLATGMNAIRHSVHNTRQDTLHLDREIQALLDGFAFCPVQYTNAGGSELSLNHKYVVMAVIREALSNIMRHSNATHAAITLSEMSGSHLLLISDNGTNSKAPQGQGMGLAAMEERVRGLGGSVHITTDHGFRILLTLPKENPL